MTITAVYSGPEEQKKFQGSAASYKPKDTDRNAPVEPSNSQLGNLRREIMTVQDDINMYLTDRMNKEKVSDQSKEKSEELEKKMLDGDEGLSDED